jgi:hypothetical protein
LINGAFVSSASLGISINPATYERIGEYPDDGGAAARAPCRKRQCADDQLHGKHEDRRWDQSVGARRMKRFGLELGGKAPMIVFDDADM